MRAQVIVLAGPSGSGKTRLAERLGLPVLRLDDFYKDGDDPSLPLITSGPNAGIVDWDHPDSWLRDDALKALTDLCESGSAEVPVYDIAHDGRTGWQRLDLGPHHLFVAEGVFAQDVVSACRDAGQLAAAYCVTHAPVVVFWRRLSRDLREHRKPPLVLLRRGLALMREQPRVVADALGKGCLLATPQSAYVRIQHLLANDPAPAMPWGPELRQPDDVSCGAASAVVARMLRDGEYAAGVLPRFGEEVQRVHRGFARLVAPDGWLQRPWPRRLGTAYWSLARWLRDLEGERYALRDAWLRPGPAFERLHRAATAGRLAVLYVGSATLPRHVTLVVGAHGDDLVVYNPASGRLHTVTRRDFTTRRLDRSLGRWARPWTVVVPSAL